MVVRAKAVGRNEDSRVTGGILGQGKDCTSICSPGGPEVVHYLSYGGSKLDGDRPWCSAGFTEFSQTEATVFEDNYKPLPARKHGEEVNGLFDHDLGNSAGWGVVKTPETVKASLAD